MAKMYHTSPSKILRIDDEYLGFCFDEACALIVTKMQNKEKPTFDEESKKENKPKKKYRSFTDLYKDVLA